MSYASPHLQSSSKPIVLIVEDDLFMAELLQLKLNRVGYETHISSTACDAFQFLENHRVDLILLDILLPGMNGLTFLKTIRLQPWGQDVCVVVLTNMDQTELIMEALELDDIVDHVVAKRSLFGETAHAGMLKYFEARLKTGVCDFLVKSQCDIEDIVEIVKKRCHAALTATATA